MSRNYSLYYFVDCLSKALLPDSVVLSDAGNTGFVTSQAIKLKDGMRYITDGAQMSMGAALPMSIGVSMATDNPVVVLVGDGSFQLNLQELATIIYHKLPIKIFVINNNGYGCIRNTQKKFFKGDFVGIDRESGLGFPDLKKIAQTYDIHYAKWDETKTKSILKEKKPIIIEVMTDPDEVIRSPFV